jgi:hypothetical protein
MDRHSRWTGSLSIPQRDPAADAAVVPNFDFQESYLRRILAFIGLRDVTFIHAEKQMRRDRAHEALAEALKQISRWVSQSVRPVIA